MLYVITTCLKILQILITQMIIYHYLNHRTFIKLNKIIIIFHYFTSDNFIILFIDHKYKLKDFKLINDILPQTIPQHCFILNMFYF